MSYIYRKLQDKMIEIYSQDKPNGSILTGVVGSGKTTLIENVLLSLKDRYQIFRFTGDDTVFRQRVRDDSKFVAQEIMSKTTHRALIFIDEVQKSEEVFDAIKYAYDHLKISFIVSGSNPAFLSTTAKKRLQRRADQFTLFPISLSELALDKKWITQNNINQFEDILFKVKTINEIDLGNINLPESIDLLIQEYFTFGGLPLVLLTNGIENKHREIRLTIERGFELITNENNSLQDTIRVELANLHSQEFTYKNIMQKSRVRRREVINSVIDQLLNHGYLLKKRPLLLVKNKTSYLTVFSYCDPGIVTYLCGTQTLDGVALGRRIEGYIHTQLHGILTNSAFKSELHYYKMYDFDKNNNVKYLPGEIDFIVSIGNKMIPIEIKTTKNISDIDLKTISEFINKNKIPFGIVLYGGVPFIDHQSKIIFWPYWMV